jgi:hypothetical protein
MQEAPIMKRRSPNLTPARIEAIVTMVRAWEGRLTWPALIQAAEERFGCAYTRQALFKHAPIRVAYDVYRSAAPASARGKLNRPVSAALQAAMDRVHRLQQENAELRTREMLLLEQFHRWAYHASSRGLTQDFLDQPLPPLNRRGNRVSSRKLSAVDAM